MTPIEKNMMYILGKLIDKRGYINAETIAALTHLSPDDINDAVGLLKSNEFAKVQYALGTSPYDFQFIEIDSKGRNFYYKSLESAHDLEMDKANMPPKIKTLLLASNPRDTPRIDIEKEFREIDEKIRATKHRDSVELIPALAVRPKDLLQLFNQHEPHIVHFSGHGCESGEIILEGDNNQSDQIHGEAIKDLFRVMKGNIRVVLLNSCYSEPQAQSIAEVIDCAIGMKDLIRGFRKTY